jgi:hypothetical protein
MEKLNDIPDTNPFKVPENYFEEVNKKIIDSTSEAENKSGKTGLFIRLKPVLAIAASVAVLIIAGYSAAKLFLPAAENKELIPEISLQEFSESYLNDIEMMMLEQNSDPLVMSGNIPDVSKSEIIDYLLLENVNENEIYELL